LPGPYAPPEGRLILAVTNGAVVGCAALRPIANDVGELKRLWVRPPFRRRRFGEVLARTLIEDARTIGYRCIRLDTLPTMTTAIALYRELGFREVPRYNDNPLPGALFFELAV